MRSPITILNTIWPKKIRLQLILFIALILLLLMSLFVFVLVKKQQSFLMEQNKAQAIGLGETFAANASPYLLINDADALQKLVQSHKGFPHLKYAMILSVDGIVLAHTNTTYLGARPSDSISLLLKNISRVQTLVENDQVLDIAVPIFENNSKEIIGWARIALEQEYIYENLQILARNGLLLTLVAIVIASFFATALAGRLVKGLSQLIAAADKIKSGDREIRVGTFKGYELAKLGAAFNEMLDELREDERLISTVVENLPIGLWILNAKGDIIFGNTAGKKIWGGVKYVGMDHFDSYKGWYLDTGKLIEPHEWGAARAIVQGESQLNREIEIEAFDGTRKIISHYSLPLRDANQRITGAVVINVDITKNKKAEATILYEKHLSDTIVRGLPGLFYIADADARFLRWNENFEKVLGYSSSETATMRTVDFIDPHYREAVFGRRPEVIEKGKLDIEVPIINKQGERKIFLFTILPVQYNNEPCFLGMGIDITDKKDKEAELQKINHDIGERVKELRCLYRMSELSNDPSKTMQDILQECADIIPPSYQYPEITTARISFNNQQFGSANFSESEWKQEAFIKAKEERVGLVEVFYTRPMPSEDEGPFLKEERLLINSLADILGSAAERKKAEAELRESEEKFRNLVEESLAGVFILQNQKFRYVNPRFEKISGYTKEILLSDLSFEDLIQEDDIPKLRVRYESVANRNNSPDHYLLRAIRSNGAIINIEVILSTISYNGSPAMIGTIIDITDMVEEEKRLNKAVTDAQEGERTQIGMELHDNVKQIMAASLINLDYAKSIVDDKNTTIETINQVKQYITDAINELRRISHRLAPSTDSSLPLTDKLQNLVSTMNVTDKINVAFSFERFKEPINNDIQLAIYRILQEQFTNILKYAKATSVSVTLEKHNGSIVMTVEDNGKGFDMSIQKAGIGLENIRRRANVLNGKVNITTSPGHGCNLVVSVPMMQ